MIENPCAAGHEARRRPSIALAACALLAVAHVACAKPPARTAPFRARPDSVQPGSLSGPFTGRVVDAATGDPVAGAMVYATWSYQSGYGGARPAGYKEYVTSTDASGRYRIPKVSEVSTPRQGAPIVDGARLSDFHLVIYKRGFVGYRSDRRFTDLGPRMDFAQDRNEIELERWRDDFSHARHLRYLGGGPALAALTAWEVKEAADELAGAGKPSRIATDLVPRRGTRTLVAAQLVTTEQIKEVTGYDGAFETGPLGDDPDTAAYSSQHFKALGRPQSYDIAVRMWQLDPGAAQQRYAALLDSLPAIEERNEIASRSLRAKENDIYGVAFLDGQRGIVVLLTCGEGQCASADQAVELGRLMHDEIVELVPLRGGRPAGGQ